MRYNPATGMFEQENAAGRTWSWIRSLKGTDMKVWYEKTAMILGKGVLAGLLVLGVVFLARVLLMVVAAALSIIWYLLPAVVVIAIIVAIAKKS